MSDDELTDLSSLSSLSPAPSDVESDVQLRPEKGILKFFHKVPKPKTTIKLTNKAKAASAGNATGAAAASAKRKTKAGAKGTPAKKNKDGGGEDSDGVGATPSKRERALSPPHEYVLADNQDIAFIVMFRNRFADAFPKNMANFGPQELERDIVDSVPSERVEHFLCALLKLLLNRQQDVKPGHYHRALEEAVQANKSQWLTSWVDSPLADGKTFAAMTPAERLALLRALVLWSMASSKTVRDVIDNAYKGKRKDDDANIPVSVQSWGNDSDKRRYYLVEGRDDTSFRVYRESNPAGFINRTWWSVAGSIDEIRVLIERLETADGGPKARKLARRLREEIPRFEATEEKRRRREYRQQQRDRFKRPEPGFSLYEGRTRGKRIKYTYSDDEDFWTDSTGPRRSARHTGTHTPSEPVTTASGRQIRAPTRLNGAPSAAASVQGDSEAGEAGDGAEQQAKELSVGPTGRPRRSAAVNHSMNGWAKRPPSNEREYDEYDSQAEDEDEESTSDAGGDEDEHVPDDDDEDEDDDEDDEGDEDGMLLDDEEEAELAAGSVVVKLPVKAALDPKTGKWEKEESGGAAPSTQRLSGASTPVNGNSKDQDDGDLDLALAGSITQGSDATAISPMQATPAKGVDAADALADKPVAKNGVPAAALDAAAAASPRADGACGKPACLGTPGKENSVPAAAGAETLAYRGSPEKTQY